MLVSFPDMRRDSRVLRFDSRSSYWGLVRKELASFRSAGEAQYMDYVRHMGLVDIFFFMVVVLGRGDCDNDFVYEVCRDLESRYVESELRDVLHLYARGHYKSSIITIGYTMRDLMIDSERTFCIFSNTNANAENRVGQMKLEFENNKLLRTLYPESCWADPEKESPRWSIQKGLILKRKGNPQEGSVEGWGVLDGMPTGRHFSHMVYDDLVTEINVGTPEQIEKTNERWRLSLNLDAINKPSVKRYIGTRYHYADTYSTMKEAGIEVIVRPATRNGKADGEPVLLTREVLDDKIKKMGAFVSAAQLFLNPIQASIKSFEASWLRRYEKAEHNFMNKYIIVDPAKSKKKGSDYTVMIVVGLHEDNNYYILSGVRDKLNLKEKWDRLLDLHKRYKPMYVGYEEYGQISDINYLQEKMEEVNYRFRIIELKGRVAKGDRIDVLMPVFEAGRVWLPYKSLFTDFEGKQRDFAREFVDDEYMFYPYGTHDDMLDAFSRIMDPSMGAVFPRIEEGDGQIYYCQDDDKAYGF